VTITKKDALASGVLDIFTNALAAIGRHTKFGNAKYPPVDGSKDLRWSFDVSTEHADAVLSHLAQRGKIDPETGYSHTVSLAWRAIALLETELIEQGAEPGRGVVRSAPEAEWGWDTYQVGNGLIGAWFNLDNSATKK
jgi:hypothetical protein